MARAKNNGTGRLNDTIANLNQAMAALAQNQAAFLGRMAASDAQIADTQRQMAETNRINAERFARIEAILMEHGRILRALPDAIRDKIGFKTPQAPPSE